MPDNNAHPNTLHYATPSKRRRRVRNLRFWTNLIIPRVAGLLAFILIAALLFAALRFGWGFLDPFGDKPMSDGIIGSVIFLCVAFLLSVVAGVFGGLFVALTTKIYLTRLHWSRRGKKRVGEKAKGNSGPSPLEAVTRHEQRRSRFNGDATSTLDTIDSAMHLLDQNSFGLAAILKSLPLAERRRIVGKACKAASLTIPNLSPEIEALLDLAVKTNSLPPSNTQRAKALADEADEKYFTLQEQAAAEPVWIEWFSKARLLTALWNGFGNDSPDGAADAIYELTCTRDDPSEILELVRLDAESASTDKSKNRDGSN